MKGKKHGFFFFTFGLLLALACGAVAAGNDEVIGDEQAKIFHRHDADHLPHVEFQVTIPNRATAAQQGYTKCKRCFLEGEFLMEVQLSKYWDEWLRTWLPLYSASDPMTRRVTEVANRILPVAARTHLPIKVYVWQHNTARSFMVLGGALVVSDTLVNMCKNDDQLAGAIAREFVLFDAEALLVAIGQLKGMDLALSVGMDTKLDADQLKEILEVTLLVAERGYGPKVELMADKMALVYMTQAGFEPEQYIELLASMPSHPAPCGVQYFGGYPGNDMKKKVDDLAGLLGRLRRRGDLPVGTPVISKTYTTDAEGLRARFLSALGDDSARVRVYEATLDLPYRVAYVKVEDLFGAYNDPAAQQKLLAAAKQAFFPLYPKYCAVVVETTQSWKKPGFWKGSIALDMR